MDSFYELPRSAPKPSGVEQIPIKPIVPEVSMIFQDKFKSNDMKTDSVYLSYKAWKDHKRNDNMINDSQRTEQQKTAQPSPQRKQLRFNNQPYSYAPEILTRPQPQRIVPNNNIVPFDKMYMANIPNRHLDLSIVEINKPQYPNENLDPNVQAVNEPARHYLNIEKIISDTKNTNHNQKKNQIDNDYSAWFSNRGTLSRQFCKEVNESGIREKNRIIDLHSNKNVNDEGIGRSLNTHDHVNSNKTNECCCKKDIHNSNNDPTIKDLLKIIQQQNEQILILQKQVATLLDQKEAHSPKEDPPAVARNFNLFDDKYKTNTHVDTNFCQSNQAFIPKKPTLQQISLDVMTNFEVSIRRPANHNRVNDLPHQPKIYEITESDCNSSTGNILDGVNKPNQSDVMFSLNEPQLQVRERCPTPINSIQVDMKDYSSDSSSEEESDVSNPSWTFYNNIMAQVNHILKKSGIQPKNIPPARMDYVPNDRIKQNMMKKVKKATLRHLKSIGVHVPPTESLDLNGQSTNAQNDVSFTVQQLLMKYLPNEQLTKITCNQNDYQKVTQPGNIKRRPEFSIATVQYMQKYNLLNDIPSPPISTPTPICEPKPNFDRILDVTAIRQQPKLL